MFHLFSFSKPINFEQFHRAVRYFEFLQFKVKEEVKMRNMSGCYGCGDELGTIHKKAADIDGNMKLFRYKSSSG